jgi:hypothetical protein
MTPERKKEIGDKLNEKLKNAQCPMCSSTSFTLLDDYFSRVLQPDYTGLTIGGPSIPTVGIFCNNCGFISEHAIGVLGLLPQQPLKTSDNAGSK